MLTLDAVPDLQRLGYTEREAAFLSLAGTASGYFLARQYGQFLNRKLGGLTQQLVDKSIARDHVDFDEYDGWRRIYHIKSRTIYRLLGDATSQNRRFKSSQEITAKLMILDYVLERLEDNAGLVCSPEEKTALFRDSLGISEASLPCGPRRGRSENASKRDRVFPDRFPVFRRQAAPEERATVQFTYFDPGLASVSAFQRHLKVYKPLFDVLRDFQLIYVGLTVRNFAAAERAFHGQFPDSKTTTDLLPHGREHFVRFLEVQRLWDNNDSRFSQNDLAVLKEGESFYDRPEHVRLRAAWLLGTPRFEDALIEICGASGTRARFVCHLLHQTYPLFGPRRRGKAIRKSPIGEISTSDSAVL